MNKNLTTLAARFSVLALAAAACAAQAGTLVINTDASDPAPKAAWEAMAKGFMAANPDVTVKINTFDHEGFKTSIRNFLTAEAPDILPTEKRYRYLSLQVLITGRVSVSEIRASQEAMEVHAETYL